MGIFSPTTVKQSLKIKEGTPRGEREWRGSLAARTPGRKGRAHSPRENDEKSASEWAGRPTGGAPVASLRASRPAPRRVGA